MQSTPNLPSDFCGTFQAAKLLGLSVGTVQALVERGELSAWKTAGGHRRIAMQSIYEYRTRMGTRMQPPEPQVASRGPSVLKLLVVDDDFSSRELIRAWIEEWGAPVECTLKASAMEALIDIGRSLPDVLITDLRVPGVDGFEFLRLLGSNPDYASVVILVMTGMTDAEIAAKGQLPKGVLVAHKPLDGAWLRGFIAASLAHLRHRRV